MLQWKKNTAAKAAALVASVAAAVSIFGLVRSNPPSAASTAPSQASPASVVAPGTSSSAQTRPAAAPARRQVVTRTRAS